MEEYKKFFEMETWREAFELQKEIFQLAQNFPRFEEYGLRSQINGSVNSVLANFAEAHGRFYYSDKIRVLYIARGEIEETQSHLIVAASRKYITREYCANLINRYERVKMKINRYISSLSKQKDNQ